MERDRREEGNELEANTPQTTTTATIIITTKKKKQGK